MYSSQIHVQQTNHPPIQNGHANHPPPPQQNAHHHPQPGPSHRPAPSQAPKEPVRVQAIPSIAVQGSVLVHGDSQSSEFCLGNSVLIGCWTNSPAPFFQFSYCSSVGSERAYTPLKVVGDGSFGTVWLVDWHSPLPPNTPLSPMQCGAGARPEWAGKRLVALKRMKRRWEGGWDECRKLKELEVCS